MRQAKLCGLVLAVLALGAFPASALDWEWITINGYTSVEFERQIESEDEGDGDPNGSFDFDGFDLVMNFRASDKVRAAVDLTWEHGAATEEGRGNVGVEYGFIEYAYSDSFRIRAGKMFTPFGIFNEIHTAKPSFLSVKEAASTNKTERIVDGAYRFYPRWGTGIAVLGEGEIGESRWEYNLLLSNGEYEEGNPFEEDDNSSKAITARARWFPTDSMKIGGSFHRDKMEGDYDRLTSAGLEFELEMGRFEIWSEVNIGSLHARDGGSTKQLGWYVQPAYHFENGVTPYVRFDFVDPDRDAKEDRGHDLIVGVNWEVAHWFMIKVENNWFKGEKNTNLGEFPGRDYNEIKAALVLGF